MSHVSFTELRRNLADCLHRVAQDRESLVVTRSGGKGNFVIMTEADFEGWKETAHLLASTKNAERHASQSNIGARGLQ